jgi:hypothetical protein
MLNRWLTLTDLDPDLRGFSNGFNWGNFGFLVPFTNGELNFREKRSFGKVVKVDLTRFELSAVEIINLPTKKRQQTPPNPDHGLRGFSDGFAAGDFGYFVPNFNGDFFGKVVRLNLRTHDVQFVDLTQDGTHLSGYSGGFSHTSRRVCCDRALGHRKDVCEPLDYDLNKVDDQFRHYCGSLDTVQPAYNAIQYMHPNPRCFPNCDDNKFDNVAKDLKVPFWEPSRSNMPQWAYGVMSQEEWRSGPYPPGTSEIIVEGFQSIPFKYPDEILVSGGFQIICCECSLFADTRSCFLRSQMSCRTHLCTKFFKNVFTQGKAVLHTSVPPHSTILRLDSIL